MLNPAGPDADKPVLGKNRRDRLERGMVEGAKRIRNQLRQRGLNISPGLARRLAVLERV